MGLDLRANIFGPGAVGQDWFRRFPVQATILYRPSDHAFREFLGSHFHALSRLTGDRVVFFTILDPPPELARTEAAESHDTHIGVSSDDPLLMQDLAGRFGVAWDRLPVLVVSPDLWSGDYVCAATDRHALKAQLESLVRVTRSARVEARGGHPTLRAITAALEPDTPDGFLLKHVLPVRRIGSDEGSQPFEDFTHALRERWEAEAREAWKDEMRHAVRTQENVDRLRHLAHAMLDGIAEIGARDSDEDASAIGPHLSRAASLIRKAGEATEEAARVADRYRAQAARRRRQAETRIQAVTSKSFQSFRRWVRSLPSDSDSTDALATDLLIVRSFENAHPIAAPVFEDEAALSYRAVAACGPGDDPSRSFGDEQVDNWVGTFQALKRSVTSLGHTDYSPAAIPLCKAVERAVNLSIVQACRAGRDIAMPTWFDRWHPGCPAERSAVRTGSRDADSATIVDINERRRDVPERHVFLSLGPATRVFRVVWGEPGGVAEGLFRRAVGRSPRTLMRALHAVRRLRNRTAHPEPMSASQVNKLHRLAVSEILPPLGQLVRTLR